MYTLKTKRWQCTGCGFTSDFDFSQKNLDLHFNNDKSFSKNYLQEGQCPSCDLVGSGALMPKDKTTGSMVFFEEGDVLELPEGGKKNIPKNEIFSKEEIAFFEKQFGYMD